MQMNTNFLKMEKGLKGEFMTSFYVAGTVKKTVNGDKNEIEFVLEDAKVNNKNVTKAILKDTKVGGYYYEGERYLLNVLPSEIKNGTIKGTIQSVIPL